jgi:hypothetical protein
VTAWSGAAKVVPLASPSIPQHARPSRRALSFQEIILIANAARKARIAWWRAVKAAA